MNFVLDLFCDLIHSIILSKLLLLLLKPFILLQTFRLNQLLCFTIIQVKLKGSLYFDNAFYFLSKFLYLLEYGLPLPYCLDFNNGPHFSFVSIESDSRLFGILRTDFLAIFKAG